MDDGVDPRYVDHWVVLPTYNEAENVALTIQGIARSIPGCTILVVDDNSPDGTAAIAEAIVEPFVTVLVHRRPRKEGLGAAYVDGIGRAISAGAQIVVQMDCDGSHDPSILPRLTGLLSVSDLAVGSRYVEGGKIIGWPFHRLLLSKLANIYARRVLGVRTRDVTTGYRAWRSSALQEIDLAKSSGTGYAFLAESLFLASRSGLIVSETPITFRDRELGKSKMALSEMINGAIFLLKVAVAKRSRSKPAASDDRGPNSTIERRAGPDPSALEGNRA